MRLTGDTMGWFKLALVIVVLCGWLVILTVHVPKRRRARRMRKQAMYGQPVEDREV